MIVTYIHTCIYIQICAITYSYLVIYTRIILHII